jgi:hypothetical protein
MGLNALRVATLSAVILIAGCASAASPAGSPAPTAPEGLAPGRPLIVVDALGGPTSIPDTWDPRSATLYADGTLVASDPRSGTLLATVSTRLAGAALDEAWATVAGTGLAVDRSLELPGLADAGTTPASSRSRPMAHDAFARRTTSSGGKVTPSTGCEPSA